MYSVGVRDHIMIAHSLAGEVFGPAQKLHGATYVVDLVFMRSELDENDIVVDIGLATDVLKRTLAAINYRNLDDLDEFRDRRSTTERLAQWISDRIATAIEAGDLGPGAHAIERIRVTLNESHVAWASFETGLKRSDR